MKLKQLRVPAIVTHKRTGRNFVVVRQPDGTRKQVYLRGAPGSAEQQTHYREVLSNLLAGKPVLPRKPTPAPSAWPTVGQLCAAFLLHAGRYYVDADGRQSRTVDNFNAAFEPLLHLYRDLPTDQFTVADMERVRDDLVAHEFGHEKDDKGNIVEGTGKKLCRRTINDRMQLVKHLWRWGVPQRLLPGSVWHEVSAFGGLPIGRSGVRDNPPVEAVPEAAVKKLLPVLTPTVRAMVEVQILGAMRPGEVVAMTRAQLTIGKQGENWIYRPKHHKNAWRGRERVIKLGPKAQALLRPRLTLAPDAAMFSPRAAWEEHCAEMRAHRQTPPTKQMRDRDARVAKAAAKLEFFDVSTYRRTVARACEKAGVEPFGLHRLRHLAGTRLVLKEGLEAARAALGHVDTRVTRRYAVAADHQLADEVAKRHG